MKLGVFSSLLSALYTDMMSITRYSEATASDGTTSTPLPSTPLYADVPCRLSFTSGENPDSKELDEVKVATIPKIFCSPSVDLRPGDYVSIQRKGDAGIVLASYSGQAGLSNMFPTHQEVLFSIKESA